MSEAEKADNSQKVVLEADEELRVQVNDNELSIELLKGHAEIFGYELHREKPTKFNKGSIFSIFTFHGCSLKLQGDNYSMEKSDKNPIIMYLQVHAGLEKMRQNADKNEEERGPITLVVGPTDSGKSTLCQLLSNYAVRMGRRPVFVDLDVGQSSISIPGTIGATLVESQIGLSSGFDSCAPLVFNFGHKAPAFNLSLFNDLVTKLSDVVKDQVKANRKAETSGKCVIK